MNDHPFSGVSSSVRLRVRTTAIITCGLLAAGMIAATGAHAGTYFFNPTLSLTGDCSVSTFDPVEDPGCPGGQHPPSGGLSRPSFVALDAYGNRYVSNYGSFVGEDGRVDVFDSAGHFITEIAEPETTGPTGVAVDSNGVLYVAESNQLTPVVTHRLSRFVPTAPYEPQTAAIAYGPRETIVEELGGASIERSALAIDPTNNHFFYHHGPRIYEFGSYTEGNPVLNAEIGEGLMQGLGGALAVDAIHHKLYAATHPESMVVRAFELGGTHQLLSTYDGSNTPTLKFVSGNSKLGVAADEENGHLFVGDLDAPKKRIYEFDGTGDLVGTTEEKLLVPDTRADIAFDNGPNSPTRGYLFAPGQTRSLAYEPKQAPKSPVVESLSTRGITEDEAVLHATVNPQGLETTYRIEYVSRQGFEEGGFAEATLAREGTLKAGLVGQPLTAPLGGLSPGGEYLIRVVAESEGGNAEKQSSFATYRGFGGSSGCANEAFRGGASAALPDCRAYELVTPPDTNGRAPLGLGLLGIYFTTSQASPDGKVLSFQVQGGSLPGYEGTGSLNGDPYRAIRGTDAWGAEATGPNGTEATAVLAGSPSLDQGYSFWKAEGAGTAVLAPSGTYYLRYPDGHSQILGQGSLATDYHASPHLISEGGEHVIFGSSTALEPGAPEDGTTAFYDLDATTGTLRVVSLLPGDQTPAAGQSAFSPGASLDGKGVAFTVGNSSPLYLRVNDEKTFEAAPEGATFEGIAEGGERLFYLQGGNLFAFDAQTETTIPFAESGDVTVTTVSPDGSAAYFLSPSVLAGENPEGAVAQPGAHNLYLSREGQLSFVGTVSKLDANGKPGANIEIGLGLWERGLEVGGSLGQVPLRSTSDGKVALFESRANLTEYDSEGHDEVYRYDAEAETLQCLSCSVIGSPAKSNADLQSIRTNFPDPEPLTAYDYTENFTDGGRRAFFESDEPLVLADTDGLKDVYEWEQEGTGSCKTQGGCLYLISSGHSVHVNYLYAVSKEGHDIFFRSSDLLLSRDAGETPSIYDARVEGGFPEPPQRNGECLGEACQPAAVPPNNATPGSSSFQGSGNVKQEGKERKARCAKDKRAVKSRGKTRCVAKHTKKSSKKRAHAKRGRAHR
jgi:hypothetical protein